MHEAVKKFLEALTKSLRDGNFVKLSLGNYKGSEFQLQRILGRRITTTRGDRLSITYRYKTRDIVKNFPVDEASETIGRFLLEGFQSGHLFTTENDLQLKIARNGSSRMHVSKNTVSAVPPALHDRPKKMQIDPGGSYLKELDITDGRGRVRDRQRDKWRQINKYIEILGDLIDKSELAKRSELKVVDMGSGKGYLTFAAYDYLANVRRINASVTGIEIRQELVDLCGRVARASGFEGLVFRQGTIADAEVENVDVLIALHACNTATDDAIFKGIMARAALIITAPCCHQELRPQIVPPEVLKDVLKHGILLEQEAETLTDGLRAMLLEAQGYRSRVFEFVGVEHTPKNNMIVGTRRAMVQDKEIVENRIQALMDLYGVRRQRLHRLLQEKRSNLDANGL